MKHYSGHSDTWVQVHALPAKGETNPFGVQVPQYHPLGYPRMALPLGCSGVKTLRTISARRRRHTSAKCRHHGKRETSIQMPLHRRFLTRSRVHTTTPKANKSLLRARSSTTSKIEFCFRQRIPSFSVRIYQLTTKLRTLSSSIVIKLFQRVTTPAE